MEWAGTVWFWSGLALALFAAEVIVPGAFLLWLGFAAGALALVVWLLPGMGLIGQSITFAILAMMSVAIGWKLPGKRNRRSANPLLNRRASQLVGRSLPLVSAIVNGRGQVRIDDAYWTVEGPDLPVGTVVRIVAAETMILRVVPME